MPNIEQVTAKYIELRDRKSEIAKRHSEEMRPLNEAMENIESWLMDQMNTLGVDSFKTSSGTPYKAVSNSVKMVDGGVFKNYIFAPAVEAAINHLRQAGYAIPDVEIEALQIILQGKARWDMVDFRAGKKGIIEHFDNTEQLPPGVTVETFAVVNVRRG